MELLRQLLSVVSVLALLGGSLWWLSRRKLARVGIGGKRNGGRARLESVERLPLAAQHVLHLVRVGDRALILAVHTSGCSLIEARPWREVEQRAGEPPAARGHAGAGR